VGDVELHWLISRRGDYSTLNGDSAPQTVDLYVQATSGGSKLHARLFSTVVRPEHCWERHGPPHKATVAPGDVRKLIDDAFRIGWDPAAKGLWEFAHQAQVGDYETHWQ